MATMICISAIMIITIVIITVIITITITNLIFNEFLIFAIRITFRSHFGSSP